MIIAEARKYLADRAEAAEMLSTWDESQLAQMLTDATMQRLIMNHAVADGQPELDLAGKSSSELLSDLLDILFPETDAALALAGLTREDLA